MSLFLYGIHKFAEYAEFTFDIFRLVAMAPTLFVAGFTNIQTLTGLNDILNTVMSIQLPFAIIPCLCFTSSRVHMGDFR